MKIRQKLTPALALTACALLLAPTATALAEPQAETFATRVAQTQPAPTTPAAQIAPTALAEEQAQPAPTNPQPETVAPRIAQAQPALPPTGDGFATKDDIRWGWEQNQRMWTEIRDEIRANRAEIREIRAEIKALYIAVVGGLVAVVAALLGIIALLIPRKNAAPTESTRTLPRPTSA